LHVRKWTAVGELEGFIEDLSERPRKRRRDALADGESQEGRATLADAPASGCLLALNPAPCLGIQPHPTRDLLE
jgi:hypothetical protein